MNDESARPLAVARVLLGTVLLVRTTALANLLPIPLAHVRGPLLGWPEPGIAFAWGGLVLPDGAKIGVAIARTLCCVLFLLGVRARITGLVAGALGYVTLSQDPFGFVFTLHALFLGVLALALGDATSELALRPERPVSASSSRRLLCFLLSSIYAWSALAKLRGEWLSGATLQALAEDGLVTPPLRSLLLRAPALRTASAWSVVIAEGLLAVGMLVVPGRLRRAMLAFALVFHLGLEVATRPDVMGFVMASLLVGALVSRPSRAARASRDAAARDRGSSGPSPPSVPRD